MIAGGEVAAQLDGVTHRYGNVIALDAVTLTLPAGCMVGLIGPDGVGKSSLLAIIAGVRQIQSGKVNVLGGDMTQSAQKCALIKAKSPVPARCGRATRYFGCHRVGCDRISLRRASMSPKIMPNSSEIRGMSVYTEHYHFTSCLQPDGTWKIA